jgi:hypothetical protein
MSSVFSKPKSPKIPKQEPIEDVAVIEDEAQDVSRRRRKKLLAGGRQSTVLSGIQNALKQRLGE